MGNYIGSTDTSNSNMTTHYKTGKTKKMDQIGLFILSPEILKISVDLQTAVTTETHLAEGKWLKEQLSLMQLHVFRVAIQMATVSGAKG
jgi:hypothetical protein